MHEVDLEVSDSPGEEAEVKLTEPKSGRSITEVKGIGKKTAETLAAAGVNTLEDLAALNDKVEQAEEDTGIENLADFIGKAEKLLEE